MKILITESQYSKVFSSYFKHVFEPHDVVDKTKRTGLTRIIWYKNNAPIVEIIISNTIYKDVTIRIQKKIWEEIISHFSINENELRYRLEKWFILNYGFENIDSIWYDTLYG